MTGYYGKPGTHYTSGVHAVRDGKPLCGYRPAKTMVFQWCANGIQHDYLECDRCRERVNGILKGVPQ